MMPFEVPCGPEECDACNAANETTAPIAMSSAAIQPLHLR